MNNQGGGLPPAPPAGAAAVSDDEDMDHDGNLARLRDIYESLREKLEEDKTIPQELVDKHGNVENLLAYLRHTYEEACKANEETAEECAELDEETAELKQECAELKQENAELDEMIAELKQETADLDAEIMKIKKQTHMLKNGQIPDEFLVPVKEWPPKRKKMEGGSQLECDDDERKINAKNAKSSQGDN